ncbi:hypothetical protein JXB28_06275 [Candidatus Woesearchaeota archaeon]|nr:hypothetical protein [Candidatus Woesearchaeota archaeon]
MKDFGDRPEKMMVVDDIGQKRIAFVMMIAGIIMWFLMDSTMPLARDMMKGISFLLFGYGAIVLSKQKPWRQLSEREKKMKMLAMAIILGLIILAFVVMLILARV